MKIVLSLPGLEKAKKRSGNCILRYNGNKIGYKSMQFYPL